MQNNLPQEEIHLFANRPLRLNKALGLCIVCTSGTIWITIEGESGDIFLRAGERYTLNSNCLALVEALDDGSIRLVPAPRPLPRLFNGILDSRRQISALGRLISGNRV